MRFSMRRRTFLGGALAVAVAPAVVACGNGPKSAAQSGPPREGGSLVLQLPTEISTNINPLDTNDPSAMGVVSGTVYSKLIEFRTGPDVRELDIVPDLAKEWEISPDGLTYTFHLRDDVRWQNVPPVSGRPFTADDVVATFTALKGVTGFHEWMIEPVTDIHATDDHTVVFTLKHPYAPLLEYLAYHFMMIIPREGVEGRYDLATQAIGTGPFILDSHKPNVEWVLRKNPDYFVKGRPYLDELHRPVLDDIAAVTAALRSGRLDAGTTTDAGVVTEFADHGYTVDAAPGAQVSFYLNPSRPPFDDIRVRKAVVAAIDWAGMGENIRKKFNLTSMLRPDTCSGALSRAEVEKLRPFKPDKARSLLAEAGHRGGFDTKLLVQRVDDEDVREAQWMQADLKEVGINVDIEVVDPATGIQRRRDHDFAMTKALRGVHLADQVWRDFEPSSRENYALVDDAKLTDMINQSRVTTDAKERDDLYRKMQTRMETEIVQALHPIQKFDQSIAADRVQDMWPSPIYQGRRLADVWLSDA